MNKVQEYLRKKEIERLGLPKIWIVKSERTGVQLPTEHQVVEIRKSVGVRNGVLSIDRYVIETGFPYEIDIVEGEMSTSEEGYGTGVGDLWDWTYYCTLSKNDADRYYIEELKRVNEKYLNNA